MTRLTITLPDDLPRALEHESATRGRPWPTCLIAESPVRYGKPEESALDLVARAREQSGFDEAGALELAATETRSVARDDLPVLRGDHAGAGRAGGDGVRGEESVPGHATELKRRT